MGKRVNYWCVLGLPVFFCACVFRRSARSVVTCDAHLSAADIMVPRVVVHRITRPVVVCAYNMRTIEERLQRGEVLFVHRAGNGAHQRMRSINHLAIQNLVIGPGDCILRHGIKYQVTSGGPHPPVLPEDVLLPVQTADCGPGGRFPPLCFGDRVRRANTTVLLDPLTCITWPELAIGDCVLLIPADGDIVLVNRQPTLVQTPHQKHHAETPFWCDCRRACWPCTCASVPSSVLPQAVRRSRHCVGTTTVTRSTSTSLGLATSGE